MKLLIRENKIKNIHDKIYRCMIVDINKKSHIK